MKKLFHNLPFRNLTKQRLVTYLILFVAVFGVGLLFLFNPWNNSASAAWFNDAWGYRKAITITVASSASDISNLDTLLTIDTTGMTANLQTNCEDLRFTDVNGTILNYFNDSCTDNSSSNTVWVRVNTVPKNTTTYTLYMYYGNASAPAGSNSTMFSLYNGLEAYWAMNESSWNTTAGEIKDNSVNVANGVARGDATTTASGQFGRGALLDGGADSFTTADNANAELGASDFTLSTWVYMTAYPVTGFGAAIITKDDGAAAFAPYALVMRSTDNNIHSWMSTTGSSWDVMNDTNLGGASALTLNAWHHVAFIREGGSCKLYIDTVVTSETSSGISCLGTLVNTAAKPYFGGQFQSPNGNGIAGRMDDARIYTRALSATDLTSLYTNPGTISTNVNATIVPSTSFAAAEKGPSPIAYWKFDEGQGTTPQDSTSSNADGVLTGTPAPVWQTEDQCIASKCIYFGGSTSRTTVATSLSGIQSVSFWVRPTSVATVGLMDFDGGTHRISVSSGTISATGFTSPTIYVNGKVFSTLVANEWQYITVTTGTGFTGSAIKVGFDNTNYTTGFFDEVKIYSSALTAAQVLANYNAKGNPDGVSSVLGTNAQNNDGDMSDGLVGYWKMDEASWTSNCSTAEVLDSSGNANHGISCPSGDANDPLAGKFGNAGDFDGTNDYVEISDNAVFDAANVAVSAWVKLDSTASNQYLVTHLHHSNGEGYGLDYKQSTGFFEFRVYDGTNNSEIAAPGTGVTAATGVWYHLVGTYDGSTVKMYVNGVLRGTASSTTPIDYTTSVPVRIGRSSDSSSNYTNGLIDETRIYNRSLNNNEVSQLYNWAPGPVGYWKLDEKIGTSVIDSSGNYPATLTNAASPATATSGWNNGKYNGGIQFDGTDDYVISNANGPISGAQPFTMSLWANTDDTGDIANNYYLYTAMHLGRHNTTNNSAPLNIMEDRIVFYPYFGTTLTYNPPSPINGQWHHVSVTYDGTTSLMYFDGVQVASGAQSLTLPAYDIFIGAGSQLADTPHRFYKGKLDDVKLYNYARSGKQVIEDMNAAHPAPGSPVSSSVAHWKLDEGFGTTANDTTPNDNDLTLSTATSAWTNSGKFGKAFIGLGTNWMSRADDADLDFAAVDDGTFSMWFKSTSATNPGATEYLFSKGPGSPTSGYAVYVTTSGTVCFGIDDDATFGPDDSSCSTADIYDATWHHITAVKTGTSSIQLFIDGQPQTADSSISATGSLANSVALYVGDLNGTDNGNEFNGSIDEFKVYRSALTAEQVKLDMNKSQAQVLGAVGDKTGTGYESKTSENQKYCIPGDTSTCTAPVLQYDFNEGTGTTVADSSGNGNYAADNIIPGTGGAWVNGKSDGKAYSFDALSTHVFAGSGSTLDNLGASGGMTAEAWIYPKSRGENNNAFIITKNAGNSQANGGWLFLINGISGNQAGLEFVVDGSSDLVRDTAATTITLNQWNHVAVSWDGVMTTASSARIFVNGKEATYTGTTNGSTRPSDAASSLYIGNASSLDRTFDGYIDQVKVYSYNRSPAQIAYSYNQGKPIAHWKMDECQGTVINDSSGNGLTGTLTNAAAPGTCTSSGSWFNGVSGKRNYSIDLDGTNDYISMGSAPSASSEYGTLSAWVKTSTDFISNQGMILYGCESGSCSDGFGAQHEIHIHFNTDETIGAFFYANTGTSTLASTQTYNDDNWHLVTATWIRGGALRLYVDGNIVASGTSTSATVFNLGPTFNIGASSVPNRYYNGQIDDARIYNYALSATQVKTLFNEGAFRVGPVTGAP